VETVGWWEFLSDSAEVFDRPKVGVEEKDTVPFEEPIDLVEVFIGSWDAGFAEDVGRYKEAGEECDAVPFEDPAPPMLALTADSVCTGWMATAWLVDGTTLVLCLD
jgi:hypothetical protein